MWLLVALCRSVCFDSITLIGLARGHKDYVWCVHVVSWSGRHFLKVCLSTIFCFSPPRYTALFKVKCASYYVAKRKKSRKALSCSRKTSWSLRRKVPSVYFERSWMACSAPTSFSIQHFWDERECQPQASPGFPKLHGSSCGRMRTNPSSSRKSDGKSETRRREVSLWSRIMPGSLEWYIQWLHVR